MQFLKQLSHILRGGEELLHVDADDVVLVAVRVELRIIGNLQPRELSSPVHRSIVVRADHVRGHRLAKATGTAYAHEALLGVGHAVLDTRLRKGITPLLSM